MPRSSFSSPPTNLDEAVDIVLGVVQVQAGPQATGGPQLAMQRLRAVVPGTNRYTFLEASTSSAGGKGVITTTNHMSCIGILEYSLEMGARKYRQDA